MISTIGFTQLCTVQRLLNAETVSVVSRDMITARMQWVEMFSEGAFSFYSRNDQPAVAQIIQDHLPNFMFCCGRLSISYTI